MNEEARERFEWLLNHENQRHAEAQKALKFLFPEYADEVELDRPITATPDAPRKRGPKAKGGRKPGVKKCAGSCGMMYPKKEMMETEGSEGIELFCKDCFEKQ